MKKSLLLSALCLLSLGSSVAMAGEAPKFTSFKTLIQEGYEIKGFITTPRNPPDPAVVNVVVTLQKGKSIASCDYHSQVWINLSEGEPGGIDVMNRCAVRSY